MRVLIKGTVNSLLVGLILGLLSGLAPVSALAGEIDESDTFQPLDLFDIAWITNPEISPDGKSVVYVRRGYDIKKDGGRSSLWTINVDGSGHEPLTGSGFRVSSPVWSPEGDRLAYVSNSEGTSQIHVRWMQTGRDIAITQLQESPQSLTWSHDGSRLAFVQFVPAAHDPIAHLPSKPEGAEWAAEAKVYEDSFYRSDSRGFLKSGKNHIFIVSAEGGKPVQLTWEDFPHDGGLAFTPDGSQLYFSSNYADDWQIDGAESNIYVVDVATREVTQVTDRDGPDFAPQVSPDGKWLLYRGRDDTPEYQDIKLYITSLAQHAPRQLVDLDRPVTGAGWAADGKSVFFSYVDQAVAKVAKTDLRGRIEVLADNLGGTSLGRPYVSGSFSVSRNETIAHDVTSPEQPANLAVTRKGDTRILTNLNKDLLAYKELGDVEELWYESSKDGLPIQGWIVKPPGFDPAKQYPLILEIHGGPTTAYGKDFAAEIQLYAAAGYVVLYTNPRGSTSYGAAFTREIDQNYPGSDYDDLMSGVDAVIAKGYVDSDNLFVTGGSGGGILTAWIVTKTNRFNAAVSQKPVINWFTHTLTADIGPFFWNNFFVELPWQDPASYLAKSPISHVDKVTTPTMLLTGEEDFRTPMSESEQFYQGLKMNGVDAALVRIQGASHSIAAKPSNLLRKVAYVLGWFERYRKNDEPES